MDELGTCLLSAANTIPAVDFPWPEDGRLVRCSSRGLSQVGKLERFKNSLALCSILPMPPSGGIGELVLLPSTGGWGGRSTLLSSTGNTEG